MQLGIVIGHATATVKHPSMTGLKLLLVQQIDLQRKPEADALLVVDKLGATSGQTVMMDTDGEHARKLVGDEHSPVRWFVTGIVDP
jgi:microcompartment protein CcmK/EutM